MKLFDFQVKALEETAGFNRVAYYMDMGLGKTFVGAEKLAKLGAKNNLLVCQKSKIADWVAHFRDNGYDSQFPLICDCTRWKKGDWEAFDPESPEGRILIINYELVWRRKALSRLSDFTLLLDESSLIQQDTAKRTKFILNLSPRNVILLSGTPTSGKYENLWSQIHLLGWPISRELFNRQYINWETIYQAGLPIPIVSRKNPYKHVDRLKEKLREHGAFFMKTEECFTLPLQNFIPVAVPTIPEYGRFRRNKVVTVDGVELVGDTIFKQILYMRMLCGQFNPYKLQAFTDLLQSTKERFIVFYNFNAELEALENAVLLMRRPISKINGKTKDLTAYENCDNSVTFVQYQAGAMGLNLQKANRIVFFTLTDKSELYEQSKKRIHRIGQDRPCFYYILMCKNSIEEHILETLNQRKDYTDELFKEREGL